MYFVLNATEITRDDVVDQATDTVRKQIDDVLSNTLKGTGWKFKSLYQFSNLLHCLTGVYCDFYKRQIDLLIILFINSPQTLLAHMLSDQVIGCQLMSMYTLFALLKLAERSGVRDVHLYAGHPACTSTRFIFWRVVGNGTHVDSAIRIVVSLLNKVTTELGTNSHGFSSVGFWRCCSISRMPAKLLLPCSMVASSGSIHKTTAVRQPRWRGWNHHRLSQAGGIGALPRHVNGSCIRAAHQQYHQEQADRRFYHGVISPGILLPLFRCSRPQLRLPARRSQRFY
jgi:hypothetical protein